MHLELSTAAFLMERERASKQKLFSSAAAFRKFRNRLFLYCVPLYYKFPKMSSP